MSGSVGMMIVEFLLTVFIAAIFYMRGDAAAAWVSLFARRIAGQSGSDSLILAASAIRAVALGVVGTAIIQTFLAGLGLAACGVPAIAILVALIFMLELAQIGPMPVLIPVVIWLFWKEQMVMASFMAVWTLFLSVFDNIITPFLMKKGADLPMLLVFAGVTGGMLVFGVIGLFIGPVVLAVTYTLLDAWVTGEVAEDERASGTMKFVQQHVLLK
jgi:predicted PurR-regulated permease PerM